MVSLSIKMKNAILQKIDLITQNYSKKNQRIMVKLKRKMKKVVVRKRKMNQKMILIIKINNNNNKLNKIQRINKMAEVQIETNY